MNDAGKPRTFLAEGPNGAPPILYHGTQRIELDELTALAWLKTLTTWATGHLFELLRRTH